MQRILVNCAIVFLIFIFFLMHTINKQNNEIKNLKQNLKIEQIQQIKINEIKQDIKILKEKRFLTYRDMQALEKIVEVEAEAEGLKGKILVANVILNRYRDNPKMSIKQIIYKPGQFCSVRNGRYKKAKFTEETKQAVKLAIEKDYSNGATSFRNFKTSNRSTDKWFNKLKIVKKYKNHVFYK